MPPLRNTWKRLMPSHQPPRHPQHFTPSPLPECDQQRRQFSRSLMTTALTAGAMLTTHQQVSAANVPDSLGREVMRLHPTGLMTSLLPFYGGDLCALAWSADGSRLAITDGMNIYVHETENGAQLWQLKKGGRQNSLGFSPKGDVLISGPTILGMERKDLTLTLLDAASGKVLRHLSDAIPKYGSNGVERYFLSPSGKLLAAVLGHPGEHINIYDISTWDVVQSIQRSVDENGQNTGARLVAIDEALGIVVTDNIVADGQVNTWDLKSGKRIASFKASLTGLSSMALDPHSGWLITGSDGVSRGGPYSQGESKEWINDAPETQVRAWNPKTGAQVQTYFAPGVKVDSLSVRGDGKYLFALKARSLLRRTPAYLLAWRLSDGKLMAAKSLDQSTDGGAALSPDGKRFAYAVDGTVRIIELDAALFQ